MDFVGVVTNVTAFGAFVDIGVHQDGLVHISQLSDRFIKDANQAVKVGERLRVRVLEVDLVRKRIALTAKSERAAASERPAAPVGASRHAAAGDSGSPRRPQGQPRRAQGGANRPQGAPAPRRQAADRRPQGFSNNPFAKLRGP
jgi:uncharacterized protein